MTSKLQRWREGSQVERAHTVKHIGEYTVGQHSHGVALIILALHPDPSADLIRAALLHDLHEVHTGDIPMFAKTEDFRKLEENTQAQIETDVTLSDEDALWLRAADSLDLLLWCREQTEMGNKNVARIHQNVSDYLWGLDLPQVLLNEVIHYRAVRSWPIGVNK